MTPDTVVLAIAVTVGLGALFVLAAEAAYRGLGP